jgi:hypothetical protein
MLVAERLCHLRRDSAAALVGAWMGDAPDDPQPARLRVEVLLLRRLHLEALEQADILLARFPNDSRLKQLRQEAQEGVVAKLRPLFDRSKKDAP